MPSFSLCSPSPCLLTVITSLILVMLVNGSPLCRPPSSPALPPLKLPVGYYRDVFINAVYDSLSLAAVTSPFSTPIFPSPLKWDVFLFFLSFFCLLSPSYVPSIRYFCPFSLFSLSKSHYFVNFVASRCQRDLICKSHSTELIPNLPPILKWAPLKQLPNLGVYNTTGLPSLSGSGFLFSYDK